MVLQNETNLGFVGTVNRGMKYSENDVILLNSDTEVTNQWIEKMNNCAYSSLDVASVTALSNNATLASVPKGLQPNDIPNGWSLDDYASMIYKTSYHDYPEIPTAHGFCMYIKRSVLNHVGFLMRKLLVKAMEKKMISHIDAWNMGINIYYVMILMFFIKRVNHLVKKTRAY